MINVLSSINWISVLVAVFAYFMLGALWSLKLFAEIYKVSLGKDGQELNNRGPLFVLGPALCVLVIIIASAILFYNNLNITTYGETIEFAMLIGIGFLFSNTTNIAINPNIPRPLLYSVINSAYHLMGITMMSLILIAMR